MNKIINIMSSKYFSCIILLFLSLNVALFLYLNAIPYVKSDGWRFIDIYLVPWFEGRLKFSDLFRDHHPQPLTAVLFILNAELFGLRMDYEGMFGVVFVILSSLILIREMKTSTTGRLAILTVATITMSLVSVNVYTWSLVTIQYIQGFFGILIVIHVDRIARKGTGLRNLSTLAIWLILFLLIFGDGAKLFAVSIAGIFLVDFLFERKIEHLKIVSVIGIAILLNSRIYDSLGVHESYSGKFINSGAESIFIYFHEFMGYVGVGLMSAWGNIAYYKSSIGFSSYVAGLAGLTVLIIYISTCFIYYKIKIYEKTKIPIVLIAQGFLTAIGAWIFRYNPEVQEPISANIPRYYMMYSFGLVGVVWIWAEYMKSRAVIIKTIVMSVMVVLIGSHTVAAISAWHTSKYIKKGIVDTCETMISHGNGDYSKKLPKFVTGGNYPEPYMKGIEFLKNNHMNVFIKNDITYKYRR